MKRTWIALFLVIMLIGLATIAQAVEYRNDGSSTVLVKNKQGGLVILSPGESIQTYYFSDDPNLTQISENPYWNPGKSTDTVTATTEGAEVAIDPESDYVIPVNITGQISIYIQSKTNTPPIRQNWDEDDPIYYIWVRGRCNKLIITGTGNVDIVQGVDE